jgi:hypothetical protein
MLLSRKERSPRRINARVGSATHQNAGGRPLDPEELGIRRVGAVLHSNGTITMVRSSGREDWEAVQCDAADLYGRDC